MKSPWLDLRQLSMFIGVEIDQVRVNTWVRAGVVEHNRGDIAGEVRMYRVDVVGSGGGELVRRLDRAAACLLKLRVPLRFCSGLGCTGCPVCSGDYIEDWYR